MACTIFYVRDTIRELLAEIDAHFDNITEAEFLANMEAAGAHIIDGQIYCFDFDGLNEN
jgi:hypothetical protein